MRLRKDGKPSSSGPQTWTCHNCNQQWTRQAVRGQVPKWCLDCRDRYTQKQCKRCKQPTAVPKGAAYCTNCNPDRSTTFGASRHPQRLRQCQWCHALGLQRFCTDECLKAFTVESGRNRQRSPVRKAIESGDHTLLISEIRKRAIHTESGCWEWYGRLDKSGYPVANIAGKRIQMHRVVLESKHGAPLGSQAAHHTCANAACVNPDHLQPVTHRDNIAEMLARRSYTARINELEEALRSIDPTHPLLNVIEVA